MDKIERAFVIAERNNIVDKIYNLKNELLAIKGIIDVIFDLDGFEDIKDIIFLTEYAIPVEAKDYFEQRKQLLKDVVAVASKHGLKTELRITDNIFTLFLTAIKNG